MSNANNCGHIIIIKTEYIINKKFSIPSRHNSLFYNSASFSLNKTTLFIIIIIPIAKTS